jgi:hypothetical protein
MVGKPVSTVACLPSKVKVGKALVICWFLSIISIDKSESVEAPSRSFTFWVMGEIFEIQGYWPTIPVWPKVKIGE